MTRPPTRKVITMCHYNRPAYSRQVIEALRDCDGIEDYLLLPHVEPGNEEVRALIEAVDFAECLPTFNSSRLGCNLNTENALLDGFSFAGFVIHVEDDIVCAPDALRYYEWCAERYANDRGVFSVTGYNYRPTETPVDAMHKVCRRQWFHPWGWATWYDRWEQFSGRIYSAPTGWDDYINLVFCWGNWGRRSREIYPELSRSQNIGLLSSITDVPPEWYGHHHHLSFWAGSQPVPRGQFHEGTPEPAAFRGPHPLDRRGPSTESQGTRQDYASRSSE